jgi:hypothetical protein
MHIHKLDVSIYVCIYIHIFIYIHISIYTYVYMYIYMFNYVFLPFKLVLNDLSVTISKPHPDNNDDDAYLKFNYNNEAIQSKSVSTRK